MNSRSLEKIGESLDRFRLIRNRGGGVSANMGLKSTTVHRFRTFDLNQSTGQVMCITNLAK